ncbi:MAG: hypothetical protein AABY75_03300 [Bacteroidota bacterium]
MLLRHFALTILAVFPLAAQTASPSDLVDPFIGTAGHGHTFPGATVPFGTVNRNRNTNGERAQRTNS